ncbi:MAG: ATP phosphoribosyltransferase regulatory subunit [Deinococcales bacterium]
MSFPAKLSPPEGTRYILPPSESMRRRLLDTLKELYDRWAYQSVDVPALEHYDPLHPVAGQSFSLSDRNGDVLNLRSDFTTAIARMVRLHYARALTEAVNPLPLRFQYSGKLWRTVIPDMARTREFTQVGLELINVSNARADAEVIHLARESLRAVGLPPRVEIGSPGLVFSLFKLAAIPKSEQDKLADAIDRKALSDVSSIVNALGVKENFREAFLSLPDLYGGVDIIPEAKKALVWPQTLSILDNLEKVLAEFEDSSELLIDLGMARRFDYYTGVSFRAYTPEFSQPLLGGGRYDHTLLPRAIGFAIGLERLLSASNMPPVSEQALVLTLDDIPARALRLAGFKVERAHEEDEANMRAYARARGMAIC